MIRILILFLIASAALFIGPLLVGLHGDVFIQIGNWRQIKTTITSLVIMLLATVLICWFVVTVLGRFMRGTKLSFLWFGKRKGRKAREQTQLALMRFLEGDYSAAEKLLIKSAKNAELPELNYLLAAELAQKQGKYDSSQQYLVLASEGQLSSELAIDVTQLRLLIEKNEFSTATLKIDSLLAKYPSKPELLRLAVHIYQKTAAYSAIIGLLPLLKKQRLYAEETLTEITVTSYRGLMKRVIEDEKNPAFLQWWQQQPKAILQNATLQAQCIDLLLKHGFSDDATKLFEHYLKHQPSVALLALLPQIDVPDWKNITKLVNRSENKLTNEHAVNRAKAVIDMKQQNWESAELRLKELVILTANQEDYNLLARCLEQQNKNQQASDTRRIALEQLNK